MLCEIETRLSRFYRPQERQITTAPDWKKHTNRGQMFQKKSRVAYAFLITSVVLASTGVRNPLCLDPAVRRSNKNTTTIRKDRSHCRAEL